MDYNEKSKEVRLSIRLDRELKESASSVLSNMGLDLTTAVKMFLTQTVTDQALPFHPHALPEATQEALAEMKHAKEYPTYATVAEMKQAIDAED
ncbi:type II toxin-antitoxin system RelB/DinJ family antitoxin [Lacticaseibacillus sharpeae]|uniref:DNA-damage-inducible protein J n=1 Tax=Lacticaseibacillus sharpeae JCM 1186 = DSM 20505 TaxID=1291052 RepID=A0A0R1ZRU4_9LACO|nr:type II toxin-antitoxin system RelB/DinJ family antitoxin [Lacticaseibacillus sharpeae]KRM54377.1 hypothetical protein FC18_GL000598 [Lacticaseibacillus sharpeae JCM 1186 = DSM 20505]